MGLEAECTVRVGRKASAGTAHLEGETLLFRGDFRVEIAFERIREVTVEGDTLVVEADEEVRFQLGPSIAERWMKLIKQPKGLFEKLELGPNARVAVVELQDSLFVSALRERGAIVSEGRVPEGAGIIFFGAETRDALRKVPLLRARMADAGTLWVVRPKGSKAISEGELFEAVRLAGLTDVKVVALSKTHTAHKCVVPVELRGQTRRRPPIVTIPPSAPVLGSPLASDASNGPVPPSSRASARPPANSKKKPTTLRPKKKR